MSKNPRGVRFSPVSSIDAPGLDRLARETCAVAERSIQEILDWAISTGKEMPHPGSGQTLQRWAALATVGAQDLEVARALEPHVDALSILNEAAGPGRSSDESSWGVYAAEGRDVRLEAVAADHREADEDIAWELSGVKPWCSLASSVTHALMTAWVGTEVRGLFSVDLRHPGVTAEPQAWVARGLSRISSGPLRLDRVPARAVGVPGWYLERAGFAWGGMGVAAVWFGGAIGVFRRMVEQSQQRPPDQIARLHLGQIDARLACVGSLFESVARQVDAGFAVGHSGDLAAARLRLAAAECVDDVLNRAAHALGPAPLTQEAAHAKRVADLHVYVRQHHAERDAAGLGLLTLQAPSW